MDFFRKSAEKGNSKARLYLGILNIQDTNNKSNDVALSLRVKKLLTKSLACVLGFVLSFLFLILMYSCF